MARPTKLTHEVQAAIVEAIRSGCFDWVAAQAAGIDPATFRRWMADERPEYRAFCAEVRQARAQARQIAEARVFNEDAFKWLRSGPGRERPDEPGWTESSNVDMTSGGQPVQMVPWAPKRAEDADRDR